MLMQLFIHVKVNFEKKIEFFPLRNFRFLYYNSQKYNNVATPYYPFLAPLFVNCSLMGG